MQATQMVYANADAFSDTLAYDPSPIAAELAASRSPDTVPPASGDARPALHRCSGGAAKDGDRKSVEPDVPNPGNGTEKAEVNYDVPRTDRLCVEMCLVFNSFSREMRST